MDVPTPLFSVCVRFQTSNLFESVGADPSLSLGWKEWGVRAITVRTSAVGFQGVPDSSDFQMISRTRGEPEQKKVLGSV